MNEEKTAVHCSFVRSFVRSKSGVSLVESFLVADNEGIVFR